MSQRNGYVIMGENYSYICVQSQLKKKRFQERRQTRRVNDIRVCLLILMLCSEVYSIHREIILPALSPRIIPAFSQRFCLFLLIRLFYFIFCSKMSHVYKDFRIFFIIFHVISSFPFCLSSQEHRLLQSCHSTVNKSSFLSWKIRVKRFLQSPFPDI